MSNERAGRAGSQKFMLPQALRGIAAFWVMFHHAYWGRHIVHLYAALPPLIAQLLFLRGFFGVEIFFVLSGFIIAHSLRGAVITGRYFRDFAIRRSLRLDPPYWAAIAFAIGMSFLSAHVVHKAYALPTRGDLLSHLTYTQMFFGYPYSISGVFWTLTYEIQFYLILIISIMAFQRLSLIVGRLSAAIVIFGPLYIIAWVWGVFIWGDNIQGFFYVNWYGFFVGTLGYWAASQRYVAIPFWLLVIGLLIFGRDVGIVCALTAVLLHVTLKNGSIVRALSFRPLQFLGAISYSLYLTHAQVQGASMNLLYRYLPRTVAGEAIALLLSALICVAAAALFWWIIERPSHALAKKFGRARRSETRTRTSHEESGLEQSGTVDITGVAPLR